MGRNPLPDGLRRTVTLKLHLAAQCGGGRYERFTAMLPTDGERVMDKGLKRFAVSRGGYESNAYARGHALLNLMLAGSGREACVEELLPSTLLHLETLVTVLGGRVAYWPDPSDFTQYWAVYAPSNPLNVDLFQQLRAQDPKRFQ